MPPSENTHGRTRLSFASVADIDEFVATLERYERVAALRASGMQKQRIARELGWTAGP